MSVGLLAGQRDEEVAGRCETGVDDRARELAKRVAAALTQCVAEGVGDEAGVEDGGGGDHGDTTTSGGTAR